MLPGVLGVSPDPTRFHSRPEPPASAGVAGLVPLHHVRRVQPLAAQDLPLLPGSAASYSATTASLYWAVKVRRLGRSARGPIGPSSTGKVCGSALVNVNVIYMSRLVP